MKQYKITVNGTTYDVGVEETGGTPEIKSVAPVQKAAPSVQTAPAAQKTQKKGTEPVKAGEGDVTSPLSGTVMSVLVKEGDTVSAGQTLLIYEAMKMENELPAPCDGKVATIHVSQGAVIEPGMVLVSLA